MKMLKKMAALLLAGVMAMALLTACGEDSKPSYRLQKVVEANQKTGKVYAEVTVYGMNAEPQNMAFAVDGKNMMINVGAPYDILVKDGKAYVLSQGYYSEVKVTEDVVSAGNATVPSTEAIKNIDVIPEYKVEATGETLYAESITVDGQRAIYCFNGDKLAYIVEQVSGKTATLKVNKWTNEFSEEVQNKMNLTGYQPAPQH